MMRHQLRALLGLALALGGSGCLSASVLSDFAADQFTEQKLCPRDRFFTREFGVQPESLLLAGTSPSGETMERYQDLTVVDSRGCAAHLTYFCWRESPGDPAKRLCEEMNLADPDAKLGSFNLKPAARKALRQRLGF
ncbi:MAG TPA: hypothetical protein VLV54_16045 [Thermoanaerobaculia bacterium]|nr:hypothetical protein [Thermoanaerobaculia bacterium]